MKKTITASAVAIALSFATATAPLAQGRETNMSRDQEAQAMISTQGSLPGSGPSSAPGSSAVGSVPPTALILGLVVVLWIAVSSGRHMYYPST